MAGKTQMMGSNGASESPPHAVAHNAKALTSHIIGLVELQSQLLLADARECARSSLLPLGVLVSGGVIALCGLPLLLMSLAYGLAAAGLALWLAMLLSGLVGMVLGGVLVLVGWKSFKPRLCILQRSGEELQQNIRWVKAALGNRSPTAGQEYGAR